MSELDQILEKIDQAIAELSARVVIPTPLEVRYTVIRTAVNELTKNIQLDPTDDTVTSFDTGFYEGVRQTVEDLRARVGLDVHR